MSDTAKNIVEQMFSQDDFSKWLGIKRVLVEYAHCILEMTVREEMTNGFGIAHGGITYALADSALAFASNSRGQKAVSIETSISHTLAVNVGDILRAEAQEEHVNHKLGQYTVKVTNQKSEIVALFKGTVYRKKESWDI